jgi:integrase
MGSTPAVQQLLDLDQLCTQLNVSPSWVYKRTKKGAPDPLPVLRGIGRLKFDAEQVRLYIAARQRPATGATLSSSDGSARVNGKRYRALTRRRFQTGFVRLREDRTPAWWEGFYREDIVDDSGQIRRKRKSVNLGLLSDVPTKRAAQRRLGEILAEINDADYRPRSTVTFSGFVKKYRELKLPSKKGTTQHGYEVNLRKHFTPFFGDIQLSEIDTETVQAFLNQKVAAGYAFDTLKNLKWGLSSVFSAAVKYGYVKSNPVRSADLPPEGIQEEPKLPTASELDLLIANLPEPLATAVWLVAVSCIRPEELAFKWSDLKVQERQLWIVRAVNRGRLHTPKYHRSNRPIQLTESDVRHLLDLKKRMNATDDDWMFPNRGKRGPIGHEQILGRRIQPVARKLGLPHITWRLLRHWGATQMIEKRVPIKAAQQRLGHSRPDLLLKRYAHVLDESAKIAAETLSSQLGRKQAKKAEKKREVSSIGSQCGSQTAAKTKKWVM